jgi:glyoxylase-like metal-dependent hydrolase (beta-lactamase superfamily II)
MKVLRLKSNPNLYCGNSYLLLGDWSTLDDVNAIIDTGSDDYILQELVGIYTGVGKNPVDKVILTHNHFDHLGGAAFLKKKYGAKVYANIYTDKLVDYTIKDGDVLKLADCDFLVIHTPGHSMDSICLYNKDAQVLFSGDTALLIRDTSSTYAPDYLDALGRLSRLKVRIIYPGHGDPIVEDPEGMIKSSLSLGQHT